MSERITQKDLESLVERINELTNSPLKPYDHETHKSNVGNYHLSYAYGGVNLHRMVNNGGGVETPLGGGYHTKRELYVKLRAFISGLAYREQS